MAVLQTIPQTSPDRLTTEIQLRAVPQRALMMYMSAAAAYGKGFRTLLKTAAKDAEQDGRATVSGNGIILLLPKDFPASRKCIGEY